MNAALMVDNMKNAYVKSCPSIVPNYDKNKTNVYCHTMKSNTFCVTNIYV